MLVTDRHRSPQRDLVETVAAAVAGGVGAVQIREKDLPDDALVEIVERIRQEVPPSTLLIVNGRPGVARITGCGLHLPAAHAAEGRGSLSVIGRSVHDLQEARQGLAEGVDYLILGPVYPTPSKPGHPGAGLERVREIGELAAPTPVFAIGGVDSARVSEVLRAGAWGVSVCGAILSSSEPKRAAEALRRAVDVAESRRDRAGTPDNAGQRR
jgi:thiamine-phosphate pyrophosphorylase